MLAALPAGHLSGLEAVVLTDRAAIGPGKTRRVAGRKYDRDACRGFYRRRHGAVRASIEIVVDNVFAGVPSKVNRRASGGSAL